ncbi:MAG: hypothetical protein ABIO70_06275 [Pseudomonadota bacterium]
MHPWEARKNESLGMGDANFDVGSSVGRSDAPAGVQPRKRQATSVLALALFALLGAGSLDGGSSQPTVVDDYGADRLPSLEEASQVTPAEEKTMVDQQQPESGGSPSAGVPAGSRDVSDADISEARAIMAEARRLEKLGREMEPLRRSQSPASLQRCGEEMRARQPLAQALRKRAEVLPSWARSAAIGPTVPLVLCVSCMKDHALQECDQVLDELAWSEELLAEE